MMITLSLNCKVLSLDKNLVSKIGHILCSNTKNELIYLYIPSIKNRLH